MMIITEVFALIDTLCQPLAAEPACLGDAHGRVLRQQIITADDMPPFTRSAMDGYLVREGEPAAELRLAGEVRPGEAAAMPDPGCCLRVFTGSAVPDSGAVVVRQEADGHGCALVVTNGGTGPALRDVTPEATRAVIDKELPGFGEIQRLQTFAIAPTSILSRATAGTRGRCLIVNLPGKPGAVTECLAVLGPALRKAIDILSPSNP